MNRTVVLAMGLIAVSLSFKSKAQDFPVTLSVVDFSELIDGVWEVSSLPLQGFIYYSADDHVEPNNIFVKVPHSQPQPRELTVRITSVDGRYVATTKAIVPTGYSGWARVPYEGAQADKMRQSTIKRMGLLVQDEQSEVYPARWGKAEATDSGLVLVNSGRSTAFLVTRNKSGRPEQTICQEAADTARLKIDRVCTIDLNKHISSDGEVNIRRRSGRGAQQPINFTVAR